MDFWKPDPAKFQPDPVFHEVLVTWPWQDQGEMLNDLSGSRNGWIVNPILRNDPQAFEELMK